MSCDCEIASVYTARIVKVRKAHKCCECDSMIEIGGQAEKADGLWDGEFRSIYTCTDCVKVRDYFRERLDELYCHGELEEFIWAEGLLWSEDDIEKDAAQWVPDYDKSVGVVRGMDCVIACTEPWLIRKNGRFQLTGIEERDRV